MQVQLLPSPAMPALPGTHYSWVGWSNVRKFLAQGNQPLALPHIPQLYSWVDWSNVGKVLAQGNNNNKQHHLGIEPGSSGSQADPKPYDHLKDTHAGRFRRSIIILLLHYI